jgi:hypothetical protein
MHISITTPIASALKNYYVQSFQEAPTDFLIKYFWIQVAVSLLKPPHGAVSEVKRPLRNRFRSETVINL